MRMKTWQIIVLLLGGLGVFCLVCISASLVIYTLPEITVKSTNIIINQERLSKPIALATNTLLHTIELLPSHTAISTDLIPPSLTMIPTNPPASKVSCIPLQMPQYGIVTKVVDGDTIDVAINNQTFPVRYIGMDTPEMGDPMGLQAKIQNGLLAEGKSVILYRDTSETDKYDRILRYVFVGDIFINYELVKLGFAEAKSYSPDTACDDYFTQAQNEALAANLGIWAALPPTQARFSSPIPLITTDNCDSAYPTVCIPPPPPDLDCKDITYRKFKVLSPDPHNFDADGDGIGCEGS